MLPIILVHVLFLASPAFGVDPRDYGCVGDGVTDDTINFRRVAAAAAGKVLSIPAGHTFLVAGINIFANTAVTGGGTLKLKALANYVSSPILNMIGDNVVIDGVTLDGNRFSQSASGYSDSFDTGAYGTGRAYRCAIKADGAGSGLTVRNCMIRNTFGAGIAARHVNRLVVTDNRFEDLNFEAVIIYSYIDKVKGGGGSGHRLSGNIVRNVDSGKRGSAPNGNAFVLSDVRGAIVSNNYAADIGRTLVKLENCEDVVVSNNTFSNSINAFAGIQTQSSAHRITISGNHIRQAGIGMQIGGVNGLSNIVVSGNTIDNTTNASIGDGIQITDPITNSMVSNNVIRKQRRAGIFVQHAGVGVVISGNVVDGLLGTSYWGYALGPADNTAEVVFTNNYSRNSAGVADRGIARDEGVIFVSAPKGKRFATLEISGNVLMTRSDRPGGRAIGMTTIGLVNKAVIHDNYTDGVIEYYDKNVVAYNNYAIGDKATGDLRNSADDSQQGIGRRKFRFSNAAPNMKCDVGDTVLNSGAGDVVLWRCTDSRGTWKRMMGIWDNGASPLGH